MSIFKITSLSLSIALGASLAATPTYATNTSKTEVGAYELAHAKIKRKSHRHCHTSLINQRLVKTCHKHRHGVLHHVRRG